ncbi:hypothetical protein DPEC_G00066430 [Dallia pectoralis]|uniref:Uncharacterized protein n=1 Tax=Dallia pectoralis TaxID=75939 RepID=A0ACC2H922_DALPE|nr:hypothetical protein DPEC_G00066430 [Dallia pectoralis]
MQPGWQSSSSSSSCSSSSSSSCSPSSSSCSPSCSPTPSHYSNHPSWGVFDGGSGPLKRLGMKSPEVGANITPENPPSA